MNSSARIAADHLVELLHTERHAMADFLMALTAFDSSRGWADLGHPNLFAFLHRDLGLSRSAAFQRKVAAGLLQRFPGVEAPLCDGRLCLSSLYELSQVLAEENLSTVLPRFFHLSAREAREVVAELAPRAQVPVKDVVRRVGGVPAVLTSEQPLRPVVRPRDEVEPLTADLRRLSITVPRRLLEKLEAARAARSHARPGAATAEILEDALDALLDRESRRRAARTDRPLIRSRAARRLDNDEAARRAFGADRMARARCRKSG